jgi:hypothetical protein
MRIGYGVLLAALALLSISLVSAAADSEHRRQSRDREESAHQRPKPPSCADKLKACDIDLAGVKARLERTEAERDQAAKEIRTQLERAVIERDEARMQRDEARTQRNEALVERNEARVQRRQNIMERDEARTQRDQAMMERDQAGMQRDQAASERDQATSERDQARADVLSLVQQVEDFAKAIRTRATQDR